ncbi:alkene reductase [Hazenella sp. IB182357]|uniref:Alkene reductase n=1 Tax=Polycladospora coralii TaxID=2771432 RepID=A0A926N586_9BACL|nr:alkene reductase [Polycladospora coralii]
MKSKTTLDKFFEPVEIGAWQLKNRVVMAPMTRCFANDETGVVGDDIVAYYRKRAADGIGLIITEGTIISPRGKGYSRVPGLYTKEQINAWRKVTDAVHQEGGKIIAQIWHVGRLSHHELTGGLPPQSASAIRAEGIMPRYRKPYDLPQEMSKIEIKEVISEYAQAAKNAIEAGFDGVEIHGAGGYLIDQFNSDISNQRSDEYGGNLKQRLTFMKEVLRAVIEVVGANRVVIRFSEGKIDQPHYRWEDLEATIRDFVEAFHESGVEMIHFSTLDFSEVREDGKTISQLLRKYWSKVIIGVGGLNPTKAEEALIAGTIDLAAIGRPLLANPDYLSRIKNDISPISYDSTKHLLKLY